MEQKLSNITTAVLVGCALITTGLVVFRGLVVPAANGVQSKIREPKFVPDWRAQRSQGVQIGPADAPVQLIEFADFECPFCAGLYKDLKSLAQRHPGQVALTFVHFPLAGHRFAMPAARIAECAGDQGRFEAMYSQLFEGQDSFGLKPWTDYATAAGVPDLVTFDSCTKKTDPIRRIEAGKELGDKLDVKGTPTLIVNGWMLGRPPNSTELEVMVRRVLAGHSPVSRTDKS